MLGAEVQREKAYPMDETETNVSATPRLDALIATQHTVAVRLALVDVAGDLVAGVLLSQLMYWTPRATIERDGERWVAKARDDWWEECRVTGKQARRALSDLEARGLVKTAVWKWNGAPTTHVRLVPAAVEEAVLRLSETPGRGPMEMTERANGNDPEGQMEMTLRGDSLTESTSESTSVPLSRADDNQKQTEAEGGNGSFPQSFEQFWSLYPRKLQKRAAYKNWSMVIAGKGGRPKTSPEKLIDAARHFTAAMRREQRPADKVMYASRFLGPDACFEDYLDPGGGAPEPMPVTVDSGRYQDYVHDPTPV